MKQINSIKDRRLFLSIIPRDFDIERDIALGPRCLVGVENIFPDWKRFNFFDVFSDRNYRKEEALLAVNIANIKLLEMANMMNLAHKCDYSLGFWRIIIMPWLINMTMTCLKRYREVEYLISQHGTKKLNVDLFGKERSWQIVDNSTLWERALRNPVFDFWLTSQFVKIMAPSSWKTNSVDIPIQDYSDENDILHKSIMLTSKRRLPVAHLPGMKRSERLLLSIYCSLISRFRSRDVVPDSKIKYVANKTNLPAKFYLVYNLILRQCLPSSLGKYFQVYNSKAASMKYYNGRLYIPSSGLLHHGIIEKFEAAHAYENGERIVLSQHGAGYGIWDFFYFSEIEYSHHAFISWGWKKHTGHNVRAIPAKSPLISDFLNRFSIKEKTGVILIGTRMSISCNRFNSEAEPLELLYYRQMKLNLYQSLSQNIQNNFKYRPYPYEIADLNDGGFFKMNAPEVGIVEGDLEPHLQNAKLVIIDYPGTLLHILMAANVPIVAVWEKDTWPISKSAEKQFNQLRKVGILHNDVASAAKHINKIWTNVDSWWQNPLTVNHRKAWLEKHGQSSRFWWFSWLRGLWYINLMPKIQRTKIDQQ